MGSLASADQLLRILPAVRIINYLHLINTARGPVADSAALAEALEKGEIAGAAVDVFEKEPPIAPDHVLLKAPHLIATPHVAFATQQAFEKRAVIVCDNIRAWLDGSPINVIQ